MNTILNQENREKCQKVIEKYGFFPQTRQVAEECCELALASLKMIRTQTPVVMKKHTPPLRNFREELVDVIVMATQAVMMTGMTEDEINEMAGAKLDEALSE